MLRSTALALWRPRPGLAGEDPPLLSLAESRIEQMADHGHCLPRGIHPHHSCTVPPPSNVAFGGGDGNYFLRSWGTCLQHCITAT